MSNKYPRLTNENLNSGKNILLQVPYHDKDKAKRLGARWSPENKCWFVASDTPALVLFKRWIPPIYNLEELFRKIEAKKSAIKDTAGCKRVEKDYHRYEGDLKIQ